MKISKQIHENGIVQISVSNSNFKIDLLNVGASIYKLFTKDKNGKSENIVLTYSEINDYINNAELYLGATVGRNAGRVGNGEVVISGKKFTLEKNNGSNNLHSGSNGISFKAFDYTYKIEGEKAVVEFSTRISDLTDGFPGNIDICIRYTIVNNTLLVDFIGKSDKDTICNLTNHSYFNLSGDVKQNIMNHEVFGPIDYMWDLDVENLPSEQISTKGFINFNDGENISSILSNKTYNFDKTKGIDHPFTLRHNGSFGIFEKNSGRRLTIESSYPEVILYTQNYSTDSNIIKGINDKKNLGIAIETQYLPNEVNMNNDAPAFLGANKKYHQWTKYTFNK